MNTPLPDSLQGLMSRLRGLGVRLRADGDRLALDAPKGAIDADLAALIRRYKEDLLRTVARAGEVRATGSGIPAAAPAESYPLSAAQKRLYFTALLDPEVTTYNILDVFQIDGPVESDRLERTLRAMVARHEGFRTAFDLRGEDPVMRVLPEVAIRLERVHAPEFTPERSGEFVRPFDLTEAPLLRAWLVEVRADLHYLVTDKHHLVFDGGSRAVFARDFVRAYLEEEAPPLALGYKDYAVWQADGDGPEIRRMGAYWDGVFADRADDPATVARAYPELWGTPPRRAHLDLGTSTVEAVRQLCRERGSSLPMFLQAVWHTVLHGYSGQREIVIGHPVDVRAGAGLEGQIGLYVNTVPILSRPRPELPFMEYAQEIRDRIIAGLDNGRFPYDTVVDRASARRNVKEDPLVDAFFNVAHADVAGAGPWERIGLREVPGDPRAALPELPCLACRFDLTLSVIEMPQDIRLALECVTSLMDEETVRGLTAGLGEVVERVLADPGVTLGDLVGTRRPADRASEG
ncbi:condensation domain-containing protein [Streptomyces sp. NBC_01618]|uniref:condensation domain-containing protein n=1 Tax=Streptomyces sp. NBC_01618 TaxID=2975900 RepID=UPI003869DAA5|nr:condensation domain-containing protein [Streptomyces sp. NBC_01618]